MPRMEGARFVGGEGPQPAQVMIVGEGPGKNEDREGRPFCGRAGYVLNTFLSKAGLPPRKDCYVTNLVKYRTSVDDDDPEESDIERDLPLLTEELKTVQPRVILTLGKHSTRVLGGSTRPMNEVVGKPLYPHIPFENTATTYSGLFTPPFPVVIPVTHPAAGLYDMNMLTGTYFGMLAAKAALEHKSLWSYFVPFHAVTDVAIDTEGDLSDPVCLSYAFGGEYAQKNLSIGGKRKGVIYSHETERLSYFNSIINSPRIQRIVLHNALYDVPMLEKMGVRVEWEKVVDTMLLAYHLQTEPQGLKALAFRYHDVDRPGYEELVAPHFRARMADFLREIYSGEVWEEQEFTKTGKPKKRLTEKKSPLGKRLKRLISDIDAGKEVDLLKRWEAIPFSVRQQRRNRKKKLPPTPKPSPRLIPKKELEEYAIADAVDTLNALSPLDQLSETLKLKEQLSLVSRIDHGALPMVDRMQRNGMLIDPERLIAVEEDLKAELATCKELLQSKYRLEKPSSGDQVAEVLYKRWGFTPPKMTDSGARGATDDKTLELIVGTVERMVEAGKRDRSVLLFFDWLQRYREAEKMLSTYCKSLWGFMDADNRIHPDLKVTRVFSGRMSSGNRGPNLMAYPSHSYWGQQLRSCFIAPPGRKLGTWDMSQIEMRVMGKESGDENMLRAFRENIDIHTFSASMIWRIPMSEVDKKAHRTPAKTSGFGILYGQTAMGCQRTLALQGLYYSEEECQNIIDSWLNSFPGVKSYLNHKYAETRRRGYVTGPSGRVRWLPGIWLTEMPWVVGEAMRRVNNHPIQEGAQALEKVAMRTIQNDVLPDFRARGYYVEPLLQIHDEIIFEFDEECAEELDIALKFAIADSGDEFAKMKGEESYGVPIEVGSVMGNNWGELDK